MFEASFNATLRSLPEAARPGGHRPLDLPNEILTPVEQRVLGNIGSTMRRKQNCSSTREAELHGASPELRAELLEFFGHPDAALRDQAKAERVGESSGRT